jgi:predicted aspartyl protease
VSWTFNAAQGLIIVRTQLYGPLGDRSVRLGLDTGATSTVINTVVLVIVGFDPAVAPDRVQMTTGSGVEFVPRLPVDRVEALGQTRHSFPVIAHTLPTSAAVDGLLGLDFFRDLELTIDFRRGLLDLK